MIQTNVNYGRVHHYAEYQDDNKNQIANCSLFPEQNGHKKLETLLNLDWNKVPDLSKSTLEISPENIFPGNNMRCFHR